LKQCDNIVALSKELGVHRRLLYTWRDQLEPAETEDGLPPGIPAKRRCAKKSAA
jgi:transposase-like protein